MKPMADATNTTRFRFWLWLIRAIGVIVPRRLAGDVALPQARKALYDFYGDGGETIEPVIVGQKDIAI